MDYFRLPGSDCPPFPCGTTDFDPRAAWWMAEFSRLAYEPKHVIAAELEQAGFDRVTLFDTEGTQAYLAHYGGTPEFAVLAFRGTENDFSDVLTDIRVFPRKTSCERFHAHGGFVHALNHVWGTSTASLHLERLKIQVEWAGAEGISEALEPLRQPGRNVFLCYTGHSLGGALAILAAHRFRPDMVYTFGAPKAAGDDLARHLNRRGGFAAYRLVNATDVVSRLPPGNRFTHVGRSVHLTARGGIVLGNSLRGHVREFLIHSFLLLVGIPLIVIVKLLFVRGLGTLASLMIPKVLLQLNRKTGVINPFYVWWRDRIKPRLLFMLTNHRIAEYSRKLAPHAVRKAAAVRHLVGRKAA